MIKNEHDICNTHYMKTPLFNLSKIILLIGITCCASFYVNGQTKAVKDAEKLAEEMQYAEAVRVLELAMIEGDTSEQLLLNLADYYKKTGNLRMATALCKPLVDKDRPRPWHLLEVSEMLIDQGRISDAEPYLRKFEEMKPKDGRAAALRNKAKKRFAIQSAYPAARLDTFLHNTTSDDNFPFLANDILYWSSDRKGGKKTSGWTGRAMFGLYKSPLNKETKYGQQQRISSKFNDGRLNVSSPCFSSDGQTLYYSANVSRPNRRGELNMQLYMAQKNEKGLFEKPIRIKGQPKESSCYHPSISKDGRYLYFASDAPDSKGGIDLYRMEKQADGEWGKAENLGSNVNTKKHDGFPIAADNGLLYFASKGHVGLGGFDIFVTKEIEPGVWQTPSNLGKPINSDFDDTSWIIIRSNFGYLVSNRSGGDDDIYEVKF